MCGVCRAGYSVVRPGRLGCSAARNKGETVCTSHAIIARTDLEGRVLYALSEHLMAPELVAVFCEEYTAELNRLRGHEGEVLRAFATKTRGKAAALKFLKRLLKRRGRAEEVVMDTLRSYGAALKEFGIQDKRVTGRWQNNRAENLCQLSRRRERAMLRFRRMHGLQRLAAVRGSAHNHFNAEQGLTTRNHYRATRSPAPVERQALCADEIGRTCRK